MTYWLQAPELFEFKCFLESGRLGALSDRPTIEAIYQFMGKPIVTERNPNIVPGSVLSRLYYDNLEVRYIDETFYQFAIYFRDFGQTDTSVECPNPFRISWYDTVSQLSFDNIVEFLKTNDINCRRVVYSMPEDDAGLTIEIITTGIRINFTDRAHIDCIHHTPSRDGVFEYTAL